MVRRPRRRPRQINLRLAEPLRHRLVVAAKERQISTNQLMRQLLEAGLETKAKPSVADLIDDLKRDLRDIVESNARKVAHSPQDLEHIGRRVTAVEAKLAGIPAAIEETLSPDLRDSKQLRERVRGASNE